MPWPAAIPRRIRRRVVRARGIFIACGETASRSLSRREYEQLADDVLATRFDDYRKSEARLVLTIVITGGVVGLLLLVERYFF